MNTITPDPTRPYSHLYRGRHCFYLAPLVYAALEPREAITNAITQELKGASAMAAAIGNTGRVAMLAKTYQSSLALVASATDGDMEAAVRRRQQLEGTEALPPAQQRTKNTYRRRAKAAEDQLGSATLGLVCNSLKKGNRTRKVDPAVVQILDGYIAEMVAAGKDCATKAEYAAYVARSAAGNVKPVSSKTFGQQFRAALDRAPRQASPSQRRQVQGLAGAPIHA